MLEISKLKINHQEAPIGLDCLREISWQMRSDERAVIQKAYEIQIAADEAFADKLYDSKYTKSSASVHVTEGLSDLRLASCTRYYVRVCAESQTGEKSEWKTGTFVTALVSDSEWLAEFITPETEADKDKSRGYYLRNSFVLRKKPKSAYALVTALGIYHFYMNGEKISNDEFAPGWTSYNRHLLYQVYDVTKALKEGENTAAAHLGPGWYKGIMGSKRTRNHYGKQSAFACQLMVQYEDGEREVFVTDRNWKYKESPVLFSEIYDGETYDAAKETRDWNKNSCEEEDWSRVTDCVAFPKERLTAQSGCKVKAMTEIPAKRIFRTPQGDTVIDFGQNLTGWVKFRIKGSRGARAVLQCFEVLDKDGNVYTENLRSAKETLTYICKDGEAAVYHPYFSFQGFQYIKVAEYPGEPKAEDFTAYAVHSDMAYTGRFRCSDKYVNQLHHNILWGMKGNFLDVPTDCPQRDERLGWTGDAQIFCRTASYLMDTKLFYSKWLTDLREEQTPEGGVPHVVPDIWTGKDVSGKIFENGTHSAAAWGDAAVIIPWTMYLMYGDTEIIRRQYQSMKGWIDFMTAHSSEYVWEYRMQFGDWVALDAEEGSYYGATPLSLTNMAYYAYSTGLFAKMAAVIGQQEDAKCYRQLYENIKAAYQKTYFDETGRMTVQTQTAQIVSLYFGLAPEPYRAQVVKDLLCLLKEHDGHLVTGFVGTPYFCQVLSDNGCADKAYALLLKDDFPSWLYQVKQGATTIWEHWDGRKPDGSMWSPAMNSFNHYAYGAVGEWLYRGIAGIECCEEAPGWKKIRIAPHIGGGLSFAEAEFESVYGRIASAWQVLGDCVKLEIEVPCNTLAELCIYDAKEIKQADGLVFTENCRTQECSFKAEAGSGKYEIIYTLKQQPTGSCLQG